MTSNKPDLNQKSLGLQLKEKGGKGRGKGENLFWTPAENSMVCLPTKSPPTMDVPQPNQKNINKS